ncbi:MAG: M48 family metallopeptidase [Vicinamibacteria bacterium]
MTTRRLAGALLLAGIAGLSFAAEAQAPDLAAPIVAPSASGSTAAPALPASGEAPATSPPPVAAFDAAAATEAYLARLTPDERERSDAYFEGGYWLRLWNFLYGLGVAWLLLGSGLARRLSGRIARLTGRRSLQVGLFGAAYVALVTLLSFPLTVYEDFFREHQYGLATQQFPGWLRDRAVGLAVSLLLLPPLLMALYAVLRRKPRTWWLWGAGVSLAFVVFLSLISPVYVDPLFNKYEPLPEGPVRSEILRLAHASSVEANDVFRFDASRQTTRISANVSGFLGTMRIRLNDNLLERCTLPEIKAVMGHEVGHYALNHVYEGIIFFAIVLSFGFAFLSRSFEWARLRWGARFGVAGVDDVTGLPLLAALLSVYFFAISPLLATYIRVNEAEADIYGLNASREPEGFAEVSLKLGEYRKLSPRPVEEWVFFDHPSGRSRIRMAMEWRAANPQ